MPLIHLTQEQTEHPARREMDAEQMAFVIQGILANENWMTNENWMRQLTYSTTRLWQRSRLSRAY